MKHAAMLLEYQTYLLYDVKINLNSVQAFKAIYYFLIRVEGRISHQFFRDVSATVSQKWLKIQNDFIKLYLDKGFKPGKLNIQIKDSFGGSLILKQENEMSDLECLEYESYSFLKKEKWRISNTLDIDIENFTIQDLRATNCLFYTILVTPKTLEILYENQFEFQKKQAEFTKDICLYINSTISKDIYKHVIYLAKQL